MRFLSLRTILDGGRSKFVCRARHSVVRLYALKNIMIFRFVPKTPHLIKGTTELWRKYFQEEQLFGVRSTMSPFGRLGGLCWLMVGETNRHGTW